MGSISGTQSTTASRNQPFFTSIKNTLSGVFRNMTCLFKKQEASTGKTNSVVLTQPSVLENKSKQTKDKIANLRNNTASSNENNATQVRETTNNNSLRGGYDPVKDLRGKLEETLPKFKLEARDLEKALEIIGSDSVDDFGKYINGLKKILNDDYDSVFLIKVAEEYAAYTDIKSADKTPREAWASIFKSSKEHSDAPEDGNQSISSTAAPEVTETPRERAWRELRSEIDRVYKQMLTAGGDKLHLTLEKYQIYALQRIAVETDHLPDWNPFLAGQGLRSEQ